jgi:hypothetical protein
MAYLKKGTANFALSLVQPSHCFQQFRLTAEEQITSDETIGANVALAEVSNGVSSFVSQSSGIFSFSSTGVYWVMFNSSLAFDNDANNVILNIDSSTDSGSSYTTIAYVKFARVLEIGIEGFASGFVHTLLDVTNTTTQRLKIKGSSSAASNCLGSSTSNITFMTFLKIANT